MITVQCDRSGVAIGYAKRRNAASMSAINRLDRLAKTLPKADRDEQIFLRQQIDLVLKIPRAAGRSLG